MGREQRREHACPSRRRRRTPSSTGRSRGPRRRTGRSSLETSAIAASNELGRGSIVAKEVEEVGCRTPLRFPTPPVRTECGSVFPDHAGPVAPHEPDPRAQRVRVRRPQELGHRVVAPAAVAARDGSTRGSSRGGAAAPSASGSTSQRTASTSIASGPSARASAIASSAAAARALVSISPNVPSSTRTDRRHETMPRVCAAARPSRTDVGVGRRATPAEPSGRRSRGDDRVLERADAVDLDPHGVAGREEPWRRCGPRRPPAAYRS